MNAGINQYTESPMEKFPQADKGTSRDELGTMAGVSGKTYTTNTRKDGSHMNTTNNENAKRIVSTRPRPEVDDRTMESLARILGYHLPQLRQGIKDLQQVFQDFQK